MEESTECIRFWYFSLVYNREVKWKSFKWKCYLVSIILYPKATPKEMQGVLFFLGTHLKGTIKLSYSILWIPGCSFFTFNTHEIQDFRQSQPSRQRRWMWSSLAKQTQIKTCGVGSIPLEEFWRKLWKTHLKNATS